MRASKGARLVLFAAIAVDCAHGSAPPPASSPSSYVNSGDPLPRPAVENPHCDDATPGATRFLDSEHTPFLIADTKGIRTAGQYCCKPWARAGSRWRALGPYGDVVGSAVVTGGEGYDVTQCFELELRAERGTLGIGVFASEGGGWQPPENPPTWQPSPEIQAALARFVEESERLLLGDAPGWETVEVPPLEKRTLYFEAPSPAYGSDETYRHAVIGGRMLLIAYWNEKDRWVLSYLDAAYASLTPDAYLPIGVFDLDGGDEGLPEIVYHESVGTSWSEVALKLNDNMQWRAAAVSIGGATI